MYDLWGNSLFGAVKLTKNSSFDKYKYSACGIRFKVRRSFSLSNGRRFGKNITIFGVDMSLFWHAHNRKKVILILGKGAKQELDNTTLIAEKEYGMN